LNQIIMPNAFIISLFVVTAFGGSKGAAKSPITQDPKKSTSQEDPADLPTTQDSKHPTSQEDPENLSTTHDPMNPTSKEDPANLPTQSRLLDPSVDPILDPTIDPITNPTGDPTLDPTCDPTDNPSLEEDIFEDAMTHYRRALDLEENYNEAHFKLAVLLEKEGNVEEAITHCRRALELDYQPAHDCLAGLLLKNDNFEEALFHYKASDNLFWHYIKNRFEDTHARNRSALEWKEDFAEAHYDFALHLREKNYDFELSITHFRRALELKDDFAEAHHSIAVLLDQKNNFEEALMHYERSVELQPNNTGFRLSFVDFLLRFAKFLQRQNKFQDAKTQYQRAVKLIPHNAEFHLQAAAFFYDQEDVEEAYSQIREALKLRPDFVMAQIGFAYLLQQEGKLEEAIPHYQRVLKEEPNINNEEAQIIHFHMGVCFETQRNFKDAHAHYLRALEFEKDFVEFTFKPRNFQFQPWELHFNKKITYYRRVLELQPNNAEAHFKFALFCENEVESRHVPSIIPDLLYPRFY